MKLRIRINKDSIGLALMSIYIFMYFTARNIFLPEVYVTISLYAFLGWGLFCVIRDRTLQLSEYTKWYLIFMLISFLMMLYSEDGINIFGGYYYLLIVSVLVTFFIAYFVKDEKGLCVLAWAYAISAFSLVVFLSATGKLVGTAGSRLGGEIFGNANIFANMMMVSAMFSLWLLIYSQHPKILNILLLIIIASCFYALGLSAGRKFIIIPFVFLYVLLLYKKDKAGKRHIIKYTLVIAILLIAAYHLIMDVPVLYDAIGIRMQRLLNGITKTGIQDASSIERGQLQLIAIKGWLESPIWGHGFNSFKFYGREMMSFFSYSHCNYTELLYNGGIILFIVYYRFYFKLFRSTKHSESPVKYKALAMAILVSLIVFEYGAVDYESILQQTLLVVASQVILFREDKMKNSKSIPTIDYYR